MLGRRPQQSEEAEASLDHDREILVAGTTRAHRHVGANAPSLLTGQLAVQRRVEEPAIAQMLEVADE